MIKIGSCSWAEKTLLESKEFYPENVTSAEGRLKYYAENFCTVEVDSSYYAIPNIKTTWLWTERSPKGFLFHIKSYGALTGHSIDVKTLPRDIQDVIPETEKRKKLLSVKDPSLLKIIAGRFIDSLAPLKEANKLGLIIFQFPPWFLYKEANLNYIQSCQEMMSGLKIAVEFRHGSWLSPVHAGDVFTFLKKNRICYITADEPQYGSLATIPFLPEATTETAYIRLHGRNRENWLKKGVETSLRYNYLYSDEELKGFIPAIDDISRKAEKTYVMFNNCHGGFAMKNAFRMRELLQDRKDIAPSVS